MDIFQFYELSRSRSGTALIPIKNASSFAFYISTRSGDFVINKGDGSSVFNHTVSNKNKDFTVTRPSSADSIGNPDIIYSSAFTGDISIKFLQGLKDVYSIATNLNNINNEALNITDIETFFKQFPNLFSVYFNSAQYTPIITEVIKGDLSKLPDSVERVDIQNSEYVNAATDFTLNLSNYSNTSKLRYFIFTSGGRSPASTMKLIGDLSKLPTPTEYLYLYTASSGSAISYSAVKVWASSFDTLYLPIRLKISETDNLFIDANNSVTTAIGGKSWTLQGVRTIISDTAVSSLIAKGFVVNCKKLASTLILNSPTNLLNDDYARFIELVGDPYDSDLFKTSTGNYGYMPNSTDLDFGTGSLRFGCTVKFNGITGTKGIMGKLIYGSAIGRYELSIDGGLIYVLTQFATGNVENTTPISTYNDGNFHTIEIECNRTTGKQTLTIDGVLINTKTFTPSSTNVTRNARFMIGGYGNSSGTGLQAGTEFNGIIKDVFVNKF